MSYVSIWKPVNERIVKAARGTKDEIIGLLLGRLQEDTIIIEGSVTGEFSAEPHRVTLSTNALAKIADGLVTGQIKGNIVGWYHSHTEGGLFFSETDVATQRKLQQFSSLITGMVVDALTGEVGYFRVEPQTGETVRLPPEKIRLYTEPSNAIPIETKLKPHVPTPAVEVRKRTVVPWQPTTRLIVSVILIALLASLAVVVAIFYRGPTPAILAISHTPISTATIGTPIEVEANVTGLLQNVTLSYAPRGSDFTQVLMNLTGPGKYGYLIPGGQVTKNIAYYISAFDTTGNKAVTAQYQIAVADFNILPQSSAFTVYRNSTNSSVFELNLLSTNGFDQPLSFSATGAPQGLDVAFSPNPSPLGTTKVEMSITANPTAPNGTSPLIIYATYTPPQSAPVTKQKIVMITIADIDLQVTPTSTQASVGSTAIFTLTLTVQKGFVDPVTLNVLGLPPGAKYHLTTSNVATLGGGPVTTTITLQINLPISTNRGIYPVTISAAGGGVLHSQTVQLTVR